MPHILYLDLAITFQYLASDNKDGIGMIRIVRSHARMGNNLKDLKNLADTIHLDCFQQVSKINEDFYDMIREDLDDNSMYVVTNSHGINGASCILYKDVLMQLAYELDSDFIFYQAVFTK